MDALNLIQSLQSLKTNGRIVTTIYLDLSTTDKLRNAETVINNLFKTKKEKTFYKNLSEAEKESVGQDIDGILKYISNQFTVEKRSLMIVSSHDAYIWKVLHLGIHIDNLLVIQDRPYIRPLLQSLSDSRHFGIVLVDQGKAKILEIRLGYVDELWSTVNILPDERFDAGFQGNEERKNLRKAESAVLSHYKITAAKLRELNSERKFNWLVLGGRKESVSEFRKYLQPELQAMIYDEVLIDANEALEKIVRKIKENYHLSKTRYEKSILEKMMREFHDNQKAVLGLKHTEHALVQGQVDTLLIKSDFHKKGWLCKWCDYITEDDESTCPNCRHEMSRTVDVSDDLAYAAIETSAHIEYLTVDMKEFEPIGAILRYSK